MRRGVFIIFFLALSALYASFVIEEIEISRGKELEFATLGKGVSSKITSQRIEVIRDFNSYNAFWKAHTGTRELIPQELEVDFSTDMVVVAFLGERMKGSGTIAIRSVLETDTNVIVNITIDVQVEHSIATIHSEQPYHVIKLERSGKLALYNLVVEED